MNKTTLSEFDEGLDRLGLEELQIELEKMRNTNVTISVINGFSGIIFLDEFNFYATENCDKEDSLVLSSKDEAEYYIEFKDIKTVYKDFMGQIYIELVNEQILQIWNENEEEYHMECNQD